MGQIRNPALAPAARMAVLTIAGWALSFCGCSQLIDPDLPEPFRLLQEPTFGTEYLLYRPSSYDNRHSWPLLVVCHGSFPDSPRRQIDHWTRLAEGRGFIVVAPTMQKPKTTGWPKQPPDANQRTINERAVLAIVDHVRAGSNVSNDRVFVHGYGEGAIPALWAGLGRGDVFRAVSVNQPKYKDEELLGATISDPYQPVLVQDRAALAIYLKDGERCIEWLRGRGVAVRPDVTSAQPETDYDRVIDFYEDVIRKEPWIHVRAMRGAGSEPLEVRFKFDTTQRLRNLRWDFGDGDASSVAEPLHVYAQPGTYRVTLVGEDDRGRDVRRTISVSAPMNEHTPDVVQSGLAP